MDHDIPELVAIFRLPIFAPIMKVLKDALMDMNDFLILNPPPKRMKAPKKPRSRYLRAGGVRK